MNKITFNDNSYMEADNNGYCIIAGNIAHDYYFKFQKAIRKNPKLTMKILINKLNECTLII